MVDWLFWYGFIKSKSYNFLDVFFESLAMDELKLKLNWFGLLGYKEIEWFNELAKIEALIWSVVYVSSVMWLWTCTH